MCPYAGRCCPVHTALHLHTQKLLACPAPRLEQPSRPQPTHSIPPSDLAQHTGGLRGGNRTCRKGLSTGSPKRCMAAKFLARRELMKSGCTACPGRTLIARCSIQAPDSPGLYALHAPSAPLSSASACTTHMPTLAAQPTPQEPSAALLTPFLADTATGAPTNPSPRWLCHCGCP